MKVYSGFCFDKPCSAKNTTLESKGTIYDYYCCQNDLCNGHGHPITNTNTNRVSKVSKLFFIKYLIKKFIVLF